MLTQPVYAHFRHPDGSWYRLWITHTPRKSARGHPWHLHASYDKSGTIAPIAGTTWYEQAYGMANWDFDSEAEVLAAFRERSDERLKHGYELREGAIPTSESDS
jgi:predicted DNA-binding WGR domain protein